MKKILKGSYLYIIGAILGGIGGYLYWQQVGCASGTCMITSSPLNSTLYFGVFGALILGSLKKKESTAK